LVRDSAKVKALEEMGWTVVEVFDFKDAAILEEALSGAKVKVT
jgi:G:T-mismatch repair DNA endonuclease (very short patch repair protein)